MRNLANRYALDPELQRSTVLANVTIQLARDIAGDVSAILSWKDCFANAVECD